MVARDATTTRTAERKRDNGAEHAPAEFDEAMIQLVRIVELYAPPPARALNRAYDEFQVLAISLDWKDPIVPGQPLDLTWSVTTSFHRALDLGRVTARVFLLDDSYNRVAPNAPLLTTTVAGSDISPNPYTSPVQTIHLSSNDPQAALFYSATTSHALEIELTGDGRNPGPYVSWARDVAVILEDPGVSWQWTDPARSKDVPWKEHYSLAGTLTNSSLYSAKDCNVTIVETEPVATAVRSYGPDNQPPRLKVNGGHAGLTCGMVVGLVQDWDWFIAFVNKVNGPLYKTFFYDLSVDMSDEFGNIYPTRLLRTYGTVQVAVSDQKVNATTAGIVAFAEFVTLSALAIATSWIPGVGAAFAVGAAAAASVAGGCTKIAEDPPVPDSRYRNVVRVEVPEVLAPLRAVPSLSHFHAALETALRIVAAIEALSEIESRILGARRDQNRRGIELQESSYREVAANLAEDGERIVDDAARAADELDMRDILGGDAKPDVVKLLRDGRVDINLLRTMTAACRGDVPVEKMSDLAGNLQLMAGSLRRMALAAQRDARRVLDGSGSASRPARS